MQRLRIKDMALNASDYREAFSRVADVQMYDGFIRIDRRGRYAPTSFCYICTSVLLSDQYGYMDPVRYRCSEEISGLFGIDFKGAEEPQILPGTYFDSFCNHSKVFVPAVTPQEIMDSHHVAVQVPWYGHKYGCGPIAAKMLGAVNACSVINNNGRRGVDHWVLPWSIAKCGADQVRAFKRKLANSCHVVSGGGSIKS